MVSVVLSRPRFLRQGEVLQVGLSFAAGDGERFVKQIAGRVKDSPLSCAPLAALSSINNIYCN